MDWTTNYTVTRLIIGAITIVLEWTPDGYKVSVNGAVSYRAKATIKDFDEAKRVGLAIARKRITETLKMLDEQIRIDEPPST